jgi:Kef-type K+ transport system membrane component KefB
LTQSSAAAAQASGAGARVPQEIEYVVLLFALFVLPRLLLRYRTPSAITSLALGAAAGMGYGLFQHDPTIRLLASLGIVSLFLFAGLDVRINDLRSEKLIVLQHLAIQAAAVFATTAAAGALLHLAVRPAMLVALALLTPSTGFILESVGSLGLSERERFWITSKAVATELLALALLFVTLQSASWGRLSGSVFVLAGMVAILPLLFRWFAVSIAPWAPKSEFAFLVMMAVVCAMVTLRLGVYYLVGAFVVGVAAQRFRQELPAMASERMLHAVEMFSTFFVPFYFFRAGLELRRSDFGVGPLLAGAIFLAAAVPLRIAMVALHRRFAMGESLRHGARIGVSMLPTLVFTLVIATILRERYNASSLLFGGLIVYTLANTLIPGLVLGTPLEFGEVPQDPAEPRAIQYPES